MKRTIQHSILILAIGFSLASCSLERKLAKEFIESRDSLAVMLFMPGYIFKTNNKAWEVENIDQLSAAQKDSALFQNSLYLKEIDDNFLISRYENALQTGLLRYGMIVYTEDQLLDFLAVEHKAYKIMIAQMELEEDIYPYRAEEIFFDSVLFFEDFELNRVNLNSWFEIARMNDPEADDHLLYASHYAMDGLDGRFMQNLFTGEVKFHYNLYPMKTEDIYTLAAMLGEKYAGYIYDYMLNEYIYRNFPQGERPKSYYTFNPQTRVIAPARDDRFIFMAK